MLLEGDSLLVADNYLIYFDDLYNDVLYRGKEVSGRSLMEYEQLVDPYENIQIKDLNSKFYLTNCLSMVKNDEKVKRVIGLLYLYHQDNLYLLVNAYKIYEIICADLGIERKEKPYKEMRSNLPEDLAQY